MAPEWPQGRIGEVAQVFDGPHATPKKTSSGPVFLGINTLDHGRLNLSDVEHLSEEDFVKWTRRVTPRAGDVVFSYETRLGEAALIPDGLRCCLGRRMGLVRVRENELDSRFFLYQYLSPEFQVFLRSRTVHGSTVDRIPLLDFPDFPIALPPIAEQRAIAHILGTLDDKIELNRRTNETLESMARAIFKSWFVDFDPVRAKASGEPPESICRRLGLTSDLLALFPDRVQDSDLGEIPKGWKAADVGHIADVIDCLHAKKPNRCSTGRLLLQLNNIRDDGLVDMADTYYISEVDYQKWISRMEATKGDCVITNVGRVGAVAQIPDGMKAALGRNMTGMRCKPAFPYPTFLIECLLSDTMRAEIARKMDVGTILNALNVRNIPKLGVVLADTRVLARFEQLCRPLRQKMEHNLLESRNLAALRDTLLPKLLSGELRVPDAEKAVAATI